MGTQQSNHKNYCNSHFLGNSNFPFSYISNHSNLNLNLISYLFIYQSNDKESHKQQLVKDREILKAVKIKAEDDEFMRHVMLFIETNMSQSSLTVDDMAQGVAVSRSVIDRKVKSIVGITPAELLRKTRIQRACKMLENIKKPISNIAYDCGFVDPKYFGKVFKQVTGITPTDYRTEKCKERR